MWKRSAGDHKRGKGKVKRRTGKTGRGTAGGPVFFLPVCLMIVSGEIFRELRSFRVTGYRISSNKWKGAKRKCRMVFLSDLHNQVYGAGNDRLFEEVRRARPDIIFIGGDMLVGKNGHDYGNAMEFLKRLPKLCPVYCANGNHEQRMKEYPEVYEQSYEEYREELLEAGVCLLENESEEILISGIPVRITGLEIPDAGYARMRRQKMDAETVRNCVGECDRDYYQILLAHNPSYMEAYLSWGADLVLSGHLHGGIVRIPGFRGVISPGFELFPKYSGGCYKEGKQTAVVSRGLGSHTIPARLFNMAEVVVLEF